MATKTNKPHSNRPDFIYGIEPVLSALGANQRRLDCLWVKENRSSRLEKVVKLAQKRNLRIRETDSEKLASLIDSRHHQGLALECGPLESFGVNEFLALPTPASELIVALDGIEDPQNLGAIIRTAAFLGAKGLLKTRRNQAPLSPAVSKASAGAMESLPIIEVGNLANALKALKANGYFVVGAATRDSVPFDQLPSLEKAVLVLGSEKSGLRELTQKHCDFLAHIPGSGAIESLNVNAAAAVLIQNLISKVAP